MFYAPGEEMAFSLVLEGMTNTVPADTYFLDWERRGDDGLVERGRAPLPVKEPLVLRTKSEKPGFVCIEANVVTKDGKRVPKNHKWEKRVFFKGGAGVAPHAVKGGKEPADYEAFWASVERRLAAVPVTAERREMPCADKAVRLYAVKVACAGPRPVTGYLTVPVAASATNRMPILACYRGAAMEEMPVPKGGPHDRIRMEINVNGYDLGRGEAYIKDFFKSIAKPGYGYGMDPESNADRETSYWQGVAMRAIRYLQWLVTLPEWDGRTLEVSAGSQGGWQALTAASRFHRVTRLVTNGTWGCDWTGQDTLGRLKSTYRPKTDAPALAYYDLVFAARRVTCPVAISFAGLGDYVSPPSSLTALYNALPVPKKITYVQGSTHGWRPKGEQSFTVDGGYDRAVKGLCAVSDSTAGGHPSVCVDADSIRAEFDGRGRPLRLMSAKGVDFLEMRRAVQPEIWRIELCRAGDPTVTTNVHAGLAKSVRVQPTADGVVFMYRDIGVLKEVVVGVRRDVREGKLRWRISATPTEGWALYATDFPRLALTTAIGRTGRDDAVLAGNGHSGILRNPGGPRFNPKDPRPVRAAAYRRSRVYGLQPGSLAAQFLTFWDATAGFYCACEDGNGTAKDVEFVLGEAGFDFRWRRFDYSETKDRQDYDIVMSAFDGDGARPVDWYDAADLYKKWALTQRWCRTPLKRRADLPDWMKDAPALLTFCRPWVENPKAIHDFFADYWTARHPGVPVVAGLVGWEKHGEWVSLDYFPMHPSDAVTRATMADLKTFNAHPWPWPSGHWWTLTRGRRPDGTFRLDFRNDFVRQDGPAMSCVRRDGVTLNTDTPDWLAGGERACLCPGSASARDFWTKNVCLELVKRGAEMIQVDQDTGAHVPECWSTRHGHKPGEGLWKTTDMRLQFEEAIAAARRIEPGFVLSFEEPNEHFLDMLFLQDYRNCRFAFMNQYDWEWADVFGYLYHEYVALFQTDVSNGNSFWWTHAAVEGHMPYARFHDRELKFENAFPGKTRAFLSRWVNLYHGEGRDWLAHGRHVRPPQVNCRTVRYVHDFRGEGTARTDMPAVFCAAYESLDGRRALVFGNATSERQDVAYRLGDGWHRLTLGPNALQLKRY